MGCCLGLMFQLGLFLFLGCFTLDGGKSVWQVLKLCLISIPKIIPRTRDKFETTPVWHVVYGCGTVIYALLVNTYHHHLH